MCFTAASHCVLNVWQLTPNHLVVYKTINCSDTEPQSVRETLFLPRWFSVTFFFFSRLLFLTAGQRADVCGDLQHKMVSPVFHRQGEKEFTRVFVHVTKKTVTVLGNSFVFYMLQLQFFLIYCKTWTFHEEIYIYITENEWGSCWSPGHKSEQQPTWSICQIPFLTAVTAVISYCCYLFIFFPGDIWALPTPGH